MLYETNMTTVNAIIECPKGINHKLTFEAKNRSFKLTKVLPAGLVFPYDFGLIPDTKGADGDPLDVIILSEISGFPGLEVECRIVGCLQCEQTERNGETMRNDRYLAVPVTSHTHSNVNDIKDLPKDMVGQLEEFFKNYNKQAGKEFNVSRKLAAMEAIALIEKSKS